MSGVARGKGVDSLSAEAGSVAASVTTLDPKKEGAGCKAAVLVGTLSLI